MNKYETLINVLDVIRTEAPEAFRRYYPLETNTEELNYARSRAFIHLFLKVKFGLVDFDEREKFITDGAQDGGIDGYYIDNENKAIYFIQSKFRTTESNFNQKEILFTELLKMDTERILAGEKMDEHEVSYNSKILTMVNKIQEVSDIARWSISVAILANLSTQVTSLQLKKLTGLNATVYDKNIVYRDLVFPVIKGTYYNAEDLKISLNLSTSSSQCSLVDYNVKTSKNECNITLVFIPTVEIASAMYKYRNSILRFNPRSFLELSKNEVNKGIANTITNLKTNEFALFNNGIVVLSYGTHITGQVGKKGQGQLIITKPQIINGGQTAYTLSRIYEENVANKTNPNIFDNKEVLLKIITLNQDVSTSETEYTDLIESISKATNQQSPVNEADRRSNDQIQIDLQNYLFEKYGWFYERKRGEYADGTKAGYIKHSQIVNRETFLRMCKCCDMEPSNAKRMSHEQLFEKQHFTNTLINSNRFDEYFGAYQCFLALERIKKTFTKKNNNVFGASNYGNGLRHGIYAVISICKFYFTADKSVEQIEAITRGILARWIQFEAFASKQHHNHSYFILAIEKGDGTRKHVFNYGNYYKGSTLAKDLQSFFKVIGTTCK